MGAIDQYLKLYEENKGLVDKGSAPLFGRFREEAYKALKGMSLPKLGSENYEHTDLEDILSVNYGLNISRLHVDVNPAASFKCDVPNMSTSLFFLINDAWAASDTAFNMLPEGVVAGSLRSVANMYPDLMGRYYASVADMRNPLVAMNTMLAQDGFVLYVPAGVKLERPVQLVDILSFGSPLMVCRRILVILGDGAEAQLLVCDHTQNHDVDFLNLQTIEIVAGRGAKFDYYDLEESGEKTRRLSSLYLKQEADSDVLIDGITLYNGVTRNEYFTRFIAPGARLSLLGMAIEDRSRRVDTYSEIRHEAGRCHANELFKYVADDRSVAAFCGRIFVAEGASGTEAYQSNRNIIGSEEARVFSKPQLEIYNDDVKCSHGTTIGQLDASQLFYMQARGLAESTARTLLKQAFMADVIAGVRMQSLKDRLQFLVEKRFSGVSASCSSCGSECGLPQAD